MVAVRSWRLTANGSWSHDRVRDLAEIPAALGHGDAEDRRAVDRATVVSPVGLAAVLIELLLSIVTGSVARCRRIGCFWLGTMHQWNVSRRADSSSGTGLLPT